jgi:hypothetical protein
MLSSFALTDDGFEGDVIGSPRNRIVASNTDQSSLSLPEKPSQLQSGTKSTTCAWEGSRDSSLLAFTSNSAQLSDGHLQTHEELDLRGAELNATAAMLKVFALRAEMAAQQALLEAGSARRRGSEKVSGIAVASTPASRSKASAKATKQMFQKSKETKMRDTTLMLRGLPENYTRDSLLELLDSQGFGGSYDFVYVPADFVKWQCFGYAFVNFISHSEALRAWQRFDGFFAWTHATTMLDASMELADACKVTWGTPLQGLTAHVDRYRNSPVMHRDVPEQCKPLIFAQGVRIQFPAPTKRIRPPRLKYGNPADITIPTSFACKLGGGNDTWNQL